MIKVYVAKMFECTNYHIEVLLHDENSNRSVILNHWDTMGADIMNGDISQNYLSRTSDHVAFHIDGSLENILQAWNEYETKSKSLCRNNCADATAWFLENFANVPNPGNCARPVTCNLVFMFCAPSYLQTCTTPGRVMDYLRYAIKHKKLGEVEMENKAPTNMSMTK